MGASPAKRAQVAQRRAQAIRLRIAGLDWDTIAERLNYASKGAACTDVSRALKANLAEQDEAVDEMRSLNRLRLERLLAGIWPKASQGSPRHSEVALRIVDRLIKLDGLDVRGVLDADATTAISMIGSLMAAITETAETVDTSPLVIDAEYVDDGD